MNQRHQLTHQRWRMKGAEGEVSLTPEGKDRMYPDSSNLLTPIVRSPLHAAKKLQGTCEPSYEIQVTEPYNLKQTKGLGN